MEHILSIPPVSFSTCDHLVWHYTATGQFTVKSYHLGFANKFLEEGSSLDSMELFWKWFWKIKLPRKILIFMWRVLNNDIPTNLLLWRKGVRVSFFCNRCDRDLAEDPAHAIFSCVRA